MDTMSGVANDAAREAELDRLITKRHEKRVADEGQRREAEMWMESVARYNERERQQNRWEWVRFFERMAASHARISEEYERRAEKLCGEAEVRGEGSS